jgi:agmatinase
MTKFLQSNPDHSSQDADVVLIGVPDESKSLARRKGTSKAPDVIRKASNDTGYFERNGRVIPIMPMRGTLLNKHIVDLGDFTRDQLYDLIIDIVRSNKIPIVIGGDHSITTIILNAIGSCLGKVGLLYFDAHPDFVASTRNYYGSVITDSARAIEFKHSMLIGTRAAEQEELENARDVGLEISSPLDILELGIVNFANKIVEKSSNIRRYVSVDLDSVDPASAPGVSIPSAGGLSSIELIYLLKRVASMGIIGMDVVELSPDYDLNNLTSDLAVRILTECIASIEPRS